MNVYLGKWFRSLQWQSMAPARIACAALLLAARAASADGANKLDNVDVTTLPGQQVQITLHTTEASPQPLAFALALSAAHAQHTRG